MDDLLRALLYRYKAGDHDAARELVLRLSPLVRGLARRFAYGGAEADDYYQVGMIGLFHAARRFNFDAQVKFIAYAITWIKGEMLSYRRNTGSSVKISRSLWEQARVLSRCREKLTSELKREPTVSELSRSSGIPTEEIALVTEASLPFSVLDEDTVAPWGGAGLLEEQMVDRLSLREGLMLLTPVERKIIDLRFFREYTQTQIGHTLSLSQRQVSRLEKRILSRLRAFLQT
ncbi:MAG: sigma-70 family RNA polymerase sigma factor [Dethiobacter sp.]|jgi:RNA polymerase sporulation-specific sigma factor|nr:sigma-70 family RNA polymerase sigma factor [Dethiobacter sp.]